MWSQWNPGWSELDDMVSAMNAVRAYLDRRFDEGLDGGTLEDRVLPAPGGSWPRINLLDGGSTLTVTAEVPGLSEKDIQLSLNQEVLTLAGERKTSAPEGYSVHRQERPNVQFSRSFMLPCRVNPERTSASVKNGILTVTLEKATEAMPRQIAVKAS